MMQKSNFWNGLIYIYVVVCKRMYEEGSEKYDIWCVELLVHAEEKFKRAFSQSSSYGGNNIEIFTIFIIKQRGFYQLHSSGP